MFGAAWDLIRSKLSIGLAVGAFLIGAQYHHYVDRTKNTVLNYHLEYEKNTHRGSLEFEDVENEKGEIVKKLKNSETGEYVYDIQKDYLPDNEFICKGLEKRVEEYDSKKLMETHEKLARVNEVIYKKLVEKNPGHVPDFNLRVQEQEDGNVQTVMCYNGKKVVVEKQHLDYIVENGEIVLEKEPKVELQGKEKEEGSGMFWYTTLAGISGAAYAGYRRRKRREEGEDLNFL